LSHNFLPYEPDQILLLPPSLNEWVAEGSLPRWVSDLVDWLDTQGDLAPFYASYRPDGWGRAAYHPCLMLKVLLYADCVGIRSSRKIAQALENDVAFRYLAANQQPNFRTIAEFRKNHLSHFTLLFVRVLQLCEAAGLAKMGRVALDGRKVGANAAFNQNRTREGLQKEVERILAEAVATDEQEDARLGAETRGDELPPELGSAAGRLKRLREAQARLDAEEKAVQEKQAQKVAAREEEERRTGKKKRGRKPKPPEQVKDRQKRANVTDPDSRIMQGRHALKQAYNAQAMVDCESQVIVAQAVTQEVNDARQVGPMLQRVEEQAGRRPSICIMDAGYWSEANSALEDEQTELLIATSTSYKQKQALREQGPTEGNPPEGLTPAERMEWKLRSEKGQETYKLRSTSVEPVFGQMVMRGLDRFQLRGFTKVSGEWALYCLVHNLLKLFRWTAARQSAPGPA
jgi:transposase